MCNNRKKIAVILPSFSIGGAENMVAQLVKYINKEKFEICVISLYQPFDTHIQRIVESSNVKIVYCMKEKNTHVKVFLNVHKALVSFAPDLIHTHMYAYAFAVPYNFIHNTKIIHTVHNKPIKEFKSKYIKLMKLLYRMDRVVPIAISDLIENELRLLYKKLKNIELVYNPVDIDMFKTERNVTKKTETLFITVGRLSDQKNHLLLIDAFSSALKEISSIKLVIIGEGELKIMLQEKITKLNLENSIKMIGVTNNVNMYLKEADVFVLSSKYEGLPLSILEAMASGLPIISTDVGGVSDIVTDNGILVMPQNCEELSKAIKKLALDNQLRLHLSKKSQQNVKKYDVSNFARQYENLYYKY